MNLLIEKANKEIGINHIDMISDLQKIEHWTSNNCDCYYVKIPSQNITTTQTVRKRYNITQDFNNILIVTTLQLDNKSYKLYNLLITASIGTPERDKIYGISEDDTKECEICNVDERTILFEPCRHYIVCLDCSKHLTKCPMCRVHIEKFVKFMSFMDV